MNDTQLTFELMYLEQLAMKRNIKLEKIALAEMMGDRDIEKSLLTKDLVKIDQDNIMTDIECYQRLRGYIPQSHQMHFKRCENSGVTYCTCMPEKTIVGGDIL